MEVTVLGAGTMGQGIAQAAVEAGYEVRLYEPQETVRTRALAAIDAFWDRGIAKGKTTPQQKQDWSARLHGTDALAPAGSGLVIEAVPEDLGLKQKVFSQLDALAPDAVLATNTSSLSVEAIASATSRPQDVVGMHFFNPVPLMPLLEIVRHPKTGPHALAMAGSVAKAMGKTSIVVNDRPGFATSRLGIVLGNEAARMVEEGVASVQDIDTAMRLGYGHPMGPLELSDLVGLDVRHAITTYLERELGGTQWRAPAITQRLVEAGELGKKTGKGFYDWSGGKRPREDL